MLQILTQSLEILTKHCVCLPLIVLYVLMLIDFLRSMSLPGDVLHLAIFSISGSKRCFLEASSTCGMTRRHFFLECCLSKSFSHNTTMPWCQCVFASVLIGASVAKISLLLISSIKPSANPELRPVDPQPLQITKMNSTVFSAIFMVFLIASPLQAAPETQVSLGQTGSQAHSQRVSGLEKLARLSFFLATKVLLEDRRPMIDDHLIPIPSKHFLLSNAQKAPNNSGRTRTTSNNLR